MKMKRKLIAAFMIPVICVSAHVFFGAVSPYHPESAPPALCDFCLVIGVVISLFFLLISTATAWLLRHFPAKWKLMYDALWMTVCGSTAIVLGMCLQTI